MATPILAMDEMVQAQENPYIIFNEAINELESQLGRGFTSIETVDTSPETTNWTLAAADQGKYIRMTAAAANTITIPDNASVALPVGFTVTVRQAGAGTTTIVGGDASPTSVVVNASALALAAQHSTVKLVKVATDEWDVITIS
jgi:hypothetical protein